MILKISGNICPTMVVQIQNFQKFMRNTSRDIIRYVFTIASKDSVRKACILYDRFMLNIVIFVVLDA